MKNESFLKNNIFSAFLYNLGLVIKICTIHIVMGISNNYFFISLSNITTIIVLYCLVCLYSKQEREKIYLITNAILSTVLFIDIIYFNHFFTLPPIHSIYQLRQIGTVSNSVFSLIRLAYFLFFLDLLLLFVYHKRKKKLSPDIKRWEKRFIVIILIFSIAFASLLNYKINIDTDGNYTPYNLGVINYHIYDILGFFAKKSLDIDEVGAFIDIIGHKNSKIKSFGLTQGKNVIVIQAESVQNFVIDKTIEGQSITPVLNNLIRNDSIYFSNYYEQVGWGNTSDAEFISHNSFYPSTKTFSYKAFEENDFFTLPSMLKDIGYTTIAFHGNEGTFWNREAIYPAQGIDTFISLEKLKEDEMVGIGLSDGSLFRQSIEILKGLNQPFYSFFVTLTSHHPFIMQDRHKALKIGDEYQDTILGDYLQTIHYFDKELGNFIKKLKQENLYDNSIIIIYGDHEGLDMRDEETNELLSSFLDKPYKEDEMFKVPFIVHIPGSGIKKELLTAGGQIDFFPTIANLMGLRLEANRIMGKDLLNTKQGFVAKQVHLIQGSFIDNDKIFIMSKDGIFENSRAWNLHTGEPISLEECQEGYERALAEINLSEYTMQNNLINIVKEKGLEYILELYQ